jgi:hypothetical protein
MPKFFLHLEPDPIPAQQQISRETVQRLHAERAGVTDPDHAAALDDQIRLHSELAGLYLDPPALPDTEPAPKSEA